jgi:hypothetical protein
MTMTDIQSQGGFAGDPAAALTLPDPDQSAAAGAAPCCGTAAEAIEAGACCGASAKAEAVASGAGCCG